MATAPAHHSANHQPPPRRATVFGVSLIVLVAGSALSALVYAFPDLLFPTVPVGVVTATAMLNRLVSPSHMRGATERFWMP